MDTESLKGLGWLLMWGGLFIVMMRYGCGAHMLRGHHHGGQGGRGEATVGNETKDPVCGMTVNSQTAAAAAVRDGETYHFCSAVCRTDSSRRQMWRFDMIGLRRVWI